MRCLAALLGVLLAASPTATAQPVTWEPVPLTSADVRALTVLPDGDIYVASRGGLQRSFDGGESWSHWLTTSDVTGVAYSIDNVLFRGSEGLCRNENDTWFACGRVTAWEDIGSGSLAFGGSVGNAADAGSRLAGIVAAPDGRGWAAIGNDVWSYRGWGPHWEPSELPVDAILHLHRGASGRLFAATTDGLFSWDPDAEGSTWSRLGLAGRTLTSAFEGPNGDVFAGSVAGSVYQLIAGTPDGGGTAIASTAVLSLYAIGSATRDGPITVLAGTAGEGLFRSTDDGATWVSVLDADDIVPALGGNAVTTWAAVSHDGLRRSDDGGATWQPVR